MRKTVSDQKKRSHDFHVISCNLIKNFFCYFYLRRLTFNNYRWFRLPIKNNCIKSLLHAIYQDGFLHSNQSCRIQFLFNNPTQRMLSHPFFRSQCNPFFSEFIEYLKSFAGLPQFKLITRKIELFHECKTRISADVYTDFMMNNDRCVLTTYL